MWSRALLLQVRARRTCGKFPTTGPRVICGPGENAGVIDIGDGQACIFKMESHNHPSFIEPYQGAATGVGGIMRDVFTMGARPIALLNALRFGDPGHPKTRRLVGGRGRRHRRLRQLRRRADRGRRDQLPPRLRRQHPGQRHVRGPGRRRQDLLLGRARRAGLPVVYFGSKTGRDGIHGATMASAEFDDASDEKRPTVQVGDPFAEKLLIEATLELMASGAVAAIQDMGAAGLTSSSVEMAGKGGVGIELDLDAVPQREEGMSAYEMMLSESQERMLAILKPGREADGQRIFEKWGLDAATIGRTTDTGHLVLKHKGEVVCDVPLAPLFDDAPLYDRPWVAPAPAAAPRPGRRARARRLGRGGAEADELRRTWPPSAGSGSSTTATSWPTPWRIRATGADAGIVRVHGTRKALAVTSDVHAALRARPTPTRAASRRWPRPGAT